MRVKDNTLIPNAQERNRRRRGRGDWQTARRRRRLYVAAAVRTRLFPRETWVRLIGEAGFEARTVACPSSFDPPRVDDLFLGVSPAK